MPLTLQEAQAVITGAHERAADRGSDALAAAGWTGPLDYANDIG